jgi:DNA invertase Pin-like site-specific DNA recombinase
MDLLKRLEELDKRGVRFKTLSQPIDTGTPIGRLLLHVLGAVAEFERALIAERTKRVQFGRGWKLPEEQRKEVAELVRQGVKTEVIAERFSISRASVRNYSRHVDQRRPRGRPPVK